MADTADALALAEVPGWDMSVPDWERRIMEGRPLVPALPLFESEAERACRVFDRLRLPDVIGQPRLADAVRPWLREIVRAIFGAYDPETHVRMIREVFLLVPKKNAKSTGAAAIMLTACIMNRRPRAELVYIAPTKTIADIAFNQTEGMIQVDAELDKLFRIQRHIRTITHLNTKATLQILAADTDVITGGKQAYTLVDETHEFARKSRAAQVFVELRGALAARPDGFLMQISTQSKTPPAGVFKAELAIARQVRDGAIRLPNLSVIYELPERLQREHAWKNPAHFALVNPNLGLSVSESFLTNELAKAQETGAEALALFASQHLNVEIGLGLRTDRWAGAEFWEGCVEPALSLEDVLDRSEVVVVGIDGGGLDDLLGFAVLGRETDTRRWLLWTHAWVHVSGLERRKSEAPRYRDLEAAGDLTIFETPEADVAAVAEIVGRIERAGLLAEKQAVGVDPVGIGAIVDALTVEEEDGEAEDGDAGPGLALERIIGIPQGWKLVGAIKTAERRLVAKTLLHGGQPLMSWAVGNARVEPRGNAVIITKQAAGTAKIDPLMATFDAVALMSTNPAARRSVYENADQIFM